MLKRKMYEELKGWKERRTDKAFLLTGARQTGKTYVIREFIKHEYECSLEINFVRDKAAVNIFQKTADVEELITNLTAFSHESLVPHRTVIFLDEIQECPEARSAIKFLIEDGRFDYIESGSLLGVEYKHVLSYPVGFEEEHRMFPLDFEEFLWANRIPEDTLSYLKDCYKKNEAVSEVVHERLIQAFRYYLVVGGMPDAVQRFVDTQNIAEVITIQQDILKLYRQDIAKYAERNRDKIVTIFDSIPSQLNKSNKRFMLGSIKKTARLDRYESSFNWLIDAGVVLPCYNVSEPKAPLKLNEQSNRFKFYLVDTGLLCAMGMDRIQFDLLQGELQVNMGSILENVFAQSLISKGYALRYYDKKKNGEIDFLIQKGKEILPIEIKSGSLFRRHASLDKLLENESWDIPRGVVFCGGQCSQENGIRYLPWYMILCVEDHLEWPDTWKVEKLW